MSGPTRTWQSGTFEADDPLANYRKKPIISQGGPNATYVGRIIIELWEEGPATDDAQKIAISADAADGNHAKLLARIAASLPRRLEKGNPFG